MQRYRDEDRYTLIDDATAVFYSMPSDYQDDWQDLRARVEGH